MYRNTMQCNVTQDTVRYCDVIMASLKLTIYTQLTVGGYGADGKDMCNEVTLMCLKASRRLPLNSPCLSLRLTPHTPEAVKEEAAKAILSGGAHPILYCDDKMIPGKYRLTHLPDARHKTHVWA